MRVCFCFRGKQSKQMQLNNIEDHENGFYQVEFDVEGENIYIEFYLINSLRRMIILHKVPSLIHISNNTRGLIYSVTFYYTKLNELYNYIMQN